MFFPGEPLEASLMFVGKARSRIKSGATEIYFTKLGSTTTCLKQLATDKHSSLLRTFVNYGCKSFITSGPGVTTIKYFEFVIYRKLTNFVVN